MQANYAPPTMEIVADVSIPHTKSREYLIDRDELIRLREDGLIQSCIVCVSCD